MLDDFLIILLESLAGQIKDQSYTEGKKIIKINLSAHCGPETHGNNS